MECEWRGEVEEKGGRCCAAACALLSRGCGLVSGVNGELCWELPMRTADNGLPLRVWPVRCCAGDWWGSVFGRRHSMALSNGHTAKLTHHSTAPHPSSDARLGGHAVGFSRAVLQLGFFPLAAGPELSNDFKKADSEGHWDSHWDSRQAAGCRISDGQRLGNSAGLPGRLRAVLEAN